MPALPGILAVGTSNPPQRYSQTEIYELIARFSPFYRNERIRQVFMNSDIDYRHLFFDIDTIDPYEEPDDLHRRFRTGAIMIAIQAIQHCLESAQIDRREIDCVIAVSCTGYLCPGLTSHIIKEMGLRTDVQRADLLGMGCAGALPGLQRAYDFVKAHPEKKALLVAVEICSACYYIDDSLETVVGNAICSDGAAAVVLGMTTAADRPKILSFETHLEPSLINSVGFEQRDGKLRIILSKDIRDIAGGLAKQLVTILLEHAGLGAESIHHWILHSGGRKVIDSLKKELDLSDAQVRHSKCVLKDFGNMSSPTVLFVLQETLQKSAPQPGERGIMLAMGPGLAVEAALLSW